MAKVFNNLGSFLGGGNASNTPIKVDYPEGIVKKGYLKKYKSTNQRFFVVHKQTGAGSPARLECYENEQKYIDKQPPKRQYLLNQNTEIEEKSDPKKPHSITLKIKTDACSVTGNSPEEINAWIRAIETAANTAFWVHSWDVEVLQKGLAGSKWVSLTGPRQLNLTKTHLSICRHDMTDKTELPLRTIRRAGYNHEFAYVEMGKLATTGSGLIWFKTFDSNIAESMSTVICKTMNEVSVIVQNDIAFPHSMPPPSPPSFIAAPSPPASLANSATIRDRTSSMSVTTSTDVMTHSLQRSGGISSIVRGRTYSLPSKVKNSIRHSNQIQEDEVLQPSPLVPDGRGGLMLLPDHQCDSLPPQSGRIDQPPPNGFVSPNESQEYPYLDMTKDGSLLVISPRQPSTPLSPPPSSSPPKSLNFITGDYVNTSTVLSSPTSQLSSRTNCVNSSNYLDMRIGTSPTLPKPIPGNLMDGDLASVGSTGSSLTSGIGTPGSSDPHLHGRISQYLRGTVMDTDSVHEDSSIEDALDMDTNSRNCLDDIDMDMECDQVDSGSMIDSSTYMNTECHQPTPNSTPTHNTPGEGGEERPTRTNSLGSKMEETNRKNRPPLQSAPLTLTPQDLPSFEPGRVRAFSVGSKVSLKLLCRGANMGGGRSPTAPHPTPTTSSTSSTPISGAARFLGHCRGDYSSHKMSAGGTVSPSSSCSSSSSFSPYAEFCPPKSKKKGARSKSTSAPMLGITYPSTSWSDSTGSYFKNLFGNKSSSNHSHNKNVHNKEHMMMDFTQKKSSYDHLTASEEIKDKKSRSFEKLKYPFVRARASTKNKKRVSEGDATSVFYRGKAIEIPNAQKEESAQEFNPSPRSNTSNTSTGSDMTQPPPGYLVMRPGNSLSMSSTGSYDYVIMNTDMPLDEGYVQMNSPRQSIGECTSPMDIMANNNNAYVDMTQGSTPESTGRTNPAYTQMSSTELSSPQEELNEPYLHELVPKNNKKKNKSRSFKESGKRKKSDAGDSKSKLSGGLSSLSKVLTLITPQNSHKTPLSPTGSPLPKSSRNSSSPFASLGRSKSKEGRDSITSVSPTSAASLLLSRTFRESNTVENENYCAMESLPETNTHTSFPRNLSNRELQSTTEVATGHHNKRSSGSFDLKSNTYLTVGGGSKRHVSEVACDCNGELKEDEYVNFSATQADVSPSVRRHRLPSISSTPCSSLNCVLLHKQQLNSPTSKLSATSLGTLYSNSNQKSNKDTSEYVDMCPTKHKISNLSASISTLPQVRERKILNTDPPNESSNYLKMDLTGNSSETSTSNVVPTGVVKKPNLPLLKFETSELVSGASTVSLEKLSIAEKEALFCKCCNVVISDRCRSHSGPGAPEASSLTNSSVMCEEEQKALSVSSSPVSYSPPTSPHLTSSSKSSLSEGGLSSASSTCTVVNVGLRLQQHRKSHASGSSTSDNTHTITILNPITSTVIRSVSEAGINTKGDEKKPCCSSQYVCLDLSTSSSSKYQPGEDTTPYSEIDFSRNDNFGTLRDAVKN